MIEPLKTIYEFYQRELEFKQVVFKNYSKTEKTTLIILIFCYAGLFMTATFLPFGLLKVAIIAVSFTCLITLFPLANKFSNRVMNVLEPKINEWEKFDSQYKRYITRRILEFNEKETNLSKEELITLGYDSRDLYLTESYTIKFPSELLSILISIAALIVALYKVESFPTEAKTNLFLAMLVCVLLFLMLWFFFKVPIEAFMNSVKNRIRRISEILIGLKYRK